MWLPWKLQKIFVKVAGGQDNWFNQVLQHLGKQTRFWMITHHPQQDEPTRWQPVSLQLYHWKIHTKNMWNQRNPTQNHRAHEPGRRVHSSTGNLKLWSTVLQSQLDILVFMRSIRAGNFTLYIQTLPKFVHCFFSSLLTITTMYGGYQFTSVK